MEAPSTTTTATTTAERSISPRQQPGPGKKQQLTGAARAPALAPANPARAAAKVAHVSSLVVDTDELNK
eukprot:91758-Rhodomonas_salina.1